MISVENVKVDALKIWALCDYKALVRNKDLQRFVNELNDISMTDRVRDSIKRHLKQKELLNNAFFLETGYYYQKNKDILGMDFLTIENELFLIDFHPVIDVLEENIETIIDTPFDDYIKLENYKRFNHSKLDFEIIQLHDVGSSSKSKSKTIKLIIDQDTLVLECDKGKFGLENNNIYPAFYAIFKATVNDRLPGFLFYKDDNHFEIIEASDEIVEALLSRSKFTYDKKGLFINDVSISIQDVDVAKQVLIKCLKISLEDKIIPLYQMKNILNDLLKEKYFDYVRSQLDANTIIDDFESGLESYSMGYRNYYFAKDMFSSQTRFSKIVNDLNGKEYDFMTFMESVFQVDDTTSKLLIVSHYFSDFDKALGMNALDRGRQCRKIVFDNIKEMSIQKGFKVINIHDPKKIPPYYRKNLDDDVIEHKKIHSTWHDRYLMTINSSNEISVFKLTGELDNFSAFDAGNKIKFNDLTVIKLSGVEKLPNNLKKEVLEYV
ncbi:MAG: hypothetical protein ACOCQD_04235 [archaeon]